jgi:hypothetical protein
MHRAGVKDYFFFVSISPPFVVEESLCSTEIFTWDCRLLGRHVHISCTVEKQMPFARYHYTRL